MKPTPEQDAVQKSPAPFKVVMANAGTGKTAAIILTAVRLFLEEEAEYIRRAERAGRAPRTNPAGHLADPEDIQRVAQLFDLITFTRKAAAEMEERFRAALAARGVQVPAEYRTKNGYTRPLKVAQTLDAKVQAIVFYPLSINHLAAETLHPPKAAASAAQRFHAHLDRLLARFKDHPHLRQELELARKKDGSFYDRPTPEAYRKGLLAKLWRGLLPSAYGEEPGPLLMELLQFEQAGWTRNAPARWLQEEVLKHPRVDADAGERLTRRVLAERDRAMRPFKADYEQFLRAERGEISPGSAPQRRALYQRLKPLLDRKRNAEALFGCYQALRSTGYHPESNPRPMRTEEGLRIVVENLDGCNLTLKQAELAFLQYEALKAELCALEFQDLADVGTELMTTLPKIAEPGNPLPAYGLRRKHVLLDESQDNSAAQWGLARAMVQAGATCTVVGDPAQSIYRFRGARSETLVELLQTAAQKRLEVRTHTLSVSMRSQPAIVTLGNHVVRDLNHFAAVKRDSRARAGAVDGRPDPLKFHACLDEAEQTELITEAARRALAAGKSVMVLFRANGEKGPLARELRLLAKNVPENRFQHLSVHRSKGLEADVVILQGFTATRWPDLRGDPAEEANIFHVAVTRAREHVHFVCPCTVKAVNGAGELVDEWVGPSPYLQQVAHLRAAFIETVEWSPRLSDMNRDQAAQLLATGQTIHDHSREELEQERYGRLQVLRLEAGLVTAEDVARKPPHFRQDPDHGCKPKPTAQIRRFLELIQKSQAAPSPEPEARPHPPSCLAAEVAP